MTAHALTNPAVGSTNPGQGGLKLVQSLGGPKLKVMVFDYDCGTDNYSVGGNDISSIWNDYGFKDVLFIGVEQKDTSTEADNRFLRVDYSAKTLLIYTAATTEASASDQGVVAARLLAVGI